MLDISIGISISCYYEYCYVQYSVYAMCFSEDSETDSESSTDDLSLIQTKQQRRLRSIIPARQRLNGVSEDDVRYQSLNVKQHGAAEALPSQRGIDASETQVVPGLGIVGPQSEVCVNNSSDPTVVQLEPQLDVVPGAHASSFEGVPGSAADPEDVEAQAQALPGPDVVRGIGRSDGQAGASLIVVHASVERDPLTSADHS